MFYVLNFENHSFISCEYAENVLTEIEKLLSIGVDEDYIEIVYRGSNGENTISIDEFRECWC